MDQHMMNKETDQHIMNKQIAQHIIKWPEKEIKEKKMSLFFNQSGTVNVSR